MSKKEETPFHEPLPKIGALNSPTHVFKSTVHIKLKFQFYLFEICILDSCVYMLNCIF